MEIIAVEKQLETGFNSPVTTSAGRLFDAVSSLLDLTHINSFEGEAAIHLEMSIGDTEKGRHGDSSVGPVYKVKIREHDSRLIIDDIFIFEQVLLDRLNNIPAEIISKKFHNTLCRIISDISLDLGLKYEINNILLSGGVFQNQYLLKNCITSLEKEGLRVSTNIRVPVNDGGISLGQAYLGALSIVSLKERKLKSCV